MMSLGLEFQGQPADDITMYSKSGALAVQQMTNMFDGVPLLQKSLGTFLIYGGAIC